MATLAGRIFDALQELTGDEFSNFKWLLRQPVNLKPGLKPFSRAALEKAVRTRTTDLIVQAYPDDAAQIVVNVLKKMKKAALLHNFPEIHQGKEREYVFSSKLA